MINRKIKWCSACRRQLEDGREKAVADPIITHADRAFMQKHRFQSSNIGYIALYPSRRLWFTLAP